MSDVRILAINPGSTSTKYAIYDGRTPLFEQTLRHSAEELASFGHVVDQLEWRRGLIVEGLRERGVVVEELNAVVGRGGLVKPIEGGVYEVNDSLYSDSEHAQSEHASNLGAMLARGIADIAGVKAYIVDPVVVDELDEVARISGIPEMPRRSMFHALNSKAIAKRYAADCGSCYEDLRLIVLHMGGGVSVSLHRGGRVVDTTNALSGGGTFSPERAGVVEPLELLEACFSGEYTKEELTHMLIGGGGLMAHLGINSMYEATQRAEAGDAEAEQIVEAFCYNVAKDVGAMSTASSGEIDAILITGGIAQNDNIVGRIKSRVGWISRVETYPGEDELGALVWGVVDVMEGKTVPKIY